MPNLKVPFVLLVTLLIFVPSVMAQEGFDTSNSEVNQDDVTTTSTILENTNTNTNETDSTNSEDISIGQIDPLVMTEMLSVIGESAKARRALIVSTSTIEEYIEIRDGTLRREISQIARTYDPIYDKEIPVQEYSKDQVITTINLIIARYKSLNSSLYRARLALNDSLDFIDKSGFDKENIREELYTITQLEGELEDQIESLVFIKDAINQGRLTPQEGLILAQSQSSQLKVKYIPLIEDFILIIDNYL